MTVSATSNRKSYTGDGSQTVFAYDFKIFKNTDLEVYQADTLKTLTTHYTVSGVGEDTGGNVTFVTAPANGDAIVILRVLPLKQETDYVEASKFPAETHESVADRAVMITQQLKEEQGRALKFAKTSAKANFDVPDPVASKVIGFNSAGSALALHDNAATQVAAAAASASGAATSATNAATSATAASTSATSSSTSATSASTSATSAASSATSAAAYLAAANIPSSLTGKALKLLAVKVTEDGYELVDVTRLKESGGQVLTLGAVADTKYLRRSGTTVVGDDIDAVKESGGTLLTLGAMADGQFLKRSGTTVTSSAVSEGNLSLSDNTTADASTIAHGFLRKLSGSATQFLNGTGAFSALDAITHKGGAGYFAQQASWSPGSTGASARSGYEAGGTVISFAVAYASAPWVATSAVSNQGTMAWGAVRYTATTEAQLYAMQAAASNPTGTWAYIALGL